MKPVATARELFDERVASALRTKTAELARIGGAFAFDVSGPEGGVWTLDLNTSPPRLVAAIGPSQCKFSLTDSDLLEVVKNPSSAMQLYFTGKLKIDGDVTLAVKLQSIFALLD